MAWTQEEGSLCIGVEVDEGVRGKDVNLEVHMKRMKLAIQEKTVLEGTFPADVVPDGSFFSMENADNSKLCVITIEKREVSGERWVELFEDEALDVSITDHVRSTVRWGCSDWAERSPAASILGVASVHAPSICPERSPCVTPCSFI